MMMADMMTTRTQMTTLTQITTLTQMTTFTQSKATNRTLISDNEGDELNEIEADDAAYTDGFDEYDLCVAPKVSNAHSCCVSCCASCSCSSHLLRQGVLFSRLLSNDFAPRL